MIVALLAIFMLIMFWPTKQRCHYCNGTGLNGQYPCPFCGGRGY